MPRLTTTAPRTILFAIALALTGTVAYQVCRIPVQVSDSVGNLLQIQHQSLWDLFLSQFSNGAYVRPLLWVQIKLAYDLAAGHEQLMFKSIHVAQLLLLAVLFVRPMQVETRGDLAAAVLALLVLFGLHTFDGTVREAFPINAFLTVVLCVLAATNLAIGKPRWWRDLAALALFSFAILTVESGILVVVAVVAARLAGLRGVSWRGVALTVLACIGYLVLRFAVLDIGSPGLGERASAFGFEILEPRQLVERFGRNPIPFYAYNVVSSLVSVLLAEPRSGAWWVTYGLWSGDTLPPWQFLNVAASAAATIIFLTTAVRSFRRWLAGVAQPRQQIILVCLVVLVANAVVSFPYSKDVIMSTGGVFFALAIYAGTALLLADAGQRATRRLVPAFVALTLCLWMPRAGALPYRLKNQAANAQTQWLEVYPWLERQQIHLTSPDARELVQRLRAYALRGRRPGVEWSGWRRVLDLN